ncbi:MAG: damage-inducible protein CinA [Rhizobiales bacterium 65-79]|jgi:nicotinamide-nucleotide amidase|nr:CinA family protein [Hyphomicrobiales bacterium]OJU02135.1 MAG: damage-inducible protein CinA [Rhizobiales bacterium 65-79]
MDADDLKPLTERVLKACKHRKCLVATAESCTGGLIVAQMTQIPGASSYVDRGFVTYSNDAKIEMLGVSPDTLEKYGAVSRETALEMAAGALRHSHAGVAIAVTGIAGPDGGSKEKPVGLVWFGLAVSGRPTYAEHRIFENKGREFVQHETVRHALEMTLAALE